MVKPSENVELSNKALEAWDDSCKELDITHFLIYGTCLGFYRDGGFIIGDSDIDLRVMCDKKKWKELVTLMGSRGLVQSGKPQGWEFSFKNTISVNIERSEKLGSIVFDNGEEYPVMPLYEELDEVEYNGRTYNLPHPVEEYLEKRYGKDWKIPDLDWDKHSAVNY